MKTITIITAAALALGTACTPTPDTCERMEGMSKEGIPIMIGEPCVIAPARVAQLIEWGHDDGEDVSLPTLPETPTSNPSTPPSEPEDDPKGDNSDANGKGGNKHDRDDFTHGGTEVAEEKKDD